MPRSGLLFAIVFALTLSACTKEPERASFKKVIIGYVPGFRGALDEVKIDARKLTHINYAFVDVKDSMAWLTNIETDTVNFRTLNELKQDNPELKILISIGGWGWSENFSDAVLTENSRKKFAATSVAIIDKYKLDGVDIDWEYPGFEGQDNVFRPEDKENFTLMFKSLREELDRAGAANGRTYLLTTAVPDFTEFLRKTEMGKAAQYLDLVNLMNYDFYGRDSAGHHSNLYHTGNIVRRSGDRGVTEYQLDGVPAEKLVMGIPFYGKSWIVKNIERHGLHQPIDSAMRIGGGYTFIKDSVIGTPGFTKYWDSAAQGPYLFNEQKRQLITYDDEESVRIKCQYVFDKNMAGVMFWQYSSDPKEYLLDEINRHFRE